MNGKILNYMLFFFFNMTIYCPVCGASNLDNASFCTSCGAKIDNSKQQVQNYQQPGYQQSGYQQPGYKPPRKDPGLAYLGTFFIPGFAYMYIGDVAKGIMIFIFTLLLYFLMLIGFFVHVYLFFTAGSLVRDHNRKLGYPE